MKIILQNGKQTETTTYFIQVVVLILHILLDIALLT